MVRNKLHVSGRTLVPDHLWFNRAQHVGHLYPFGSLCFSHVMPSKQISKLAPKSEQCLFLGVDPIQRAYRLFHLSKNDVILSRNIMSYG